MNRLSQVLAEVRAVHPVRINSDGGLNRSDLPDGRLLWRRLATQDPALVHEGLEGLRRLDRISLLHAAPEFRKSSIMPTVLHAMLRRGELRWAPLAVDVQISTDGGAELGPHLRRIPQGRHSIPIPDVLSSVVPHEQPLSRIVQSYVSRNLPLDRLLAGLDTTMWRPLRDDIRRAVLSAPVVSTAMFAAREGEGNVPRLVSEILDGDCGAWYGRYLHEVSVSDRAQTDPILIDIVRRYLAPFEGRQFWSTVSADKADWVQRWSIQNHLEEFLDGGRRVTFWKRFLRHIQAVQRTRDREVVAIIFRDFAAFTFVKPGTSTRLVYRQVARQFSSCYEADVRSRLATAHDLGRYDQRGDFWEVGASQVVEEMLRRTAVR